MAPAPLPIGLYPTPLHPLRRLSDRLGVPVWVKREDLCGVAAGGNKVRKVRALLADAVARGATAVLTAGAVQSNHCAQTAVAAATLGLPVELFLQGDDPGGRPGNLLLDDRAGAVAHFATTTSCVDDMHARAAELEAAGEVPYVIPLGGSNELGAAACAGIAEEAASQLPEPGDIGTIVVAASTGGTAAGIARGVAGLGLPWRVRAVAVLAGEAETRATIEGLGAPPSVLDVDGGQLGGGYGVPTPEAAAAAEVALRAEGLVLDGTYTAKAFASLLADPGMGGRGVVFVHTGGLGGFFAAH